MQTQEITSSAFTLREQLVELESERATAGLIHLDANPSYMDDLLAELDATRAAYVGAAVTEIASLRGAIDGVLRG